MKTNCPVFHPSLEEFSDFEKYMEKVEAESAGFGMAKIVPPASWCARKKGYDKISAKVSHPIKQLVTGLTGSYQVYLISEPEMSYKSFKSYAQKRELPDNLSVDLVERMFWKNIRFDAPVYGADSDTSSLFDEAALWNMTDLPSVLNDGLKAEKLRGINTPFLYFGSWKSMFCWHKEDLDLYSINYLHFGKPKFWYCVPPEGSEKFERLCQSKFRNEHKACHEFLRHKSTQLSPSVLKSAGVKFSTMVHNPGEFMVIFSGCYHMGFNFGFNCAEAVNFALEKWIAAGEKARRCVCDGDTAFIEMDAFRKNLEMSRAERIRKKQRI